MSSVICTCRNIAVKTLSVLFKARESRTAVFREGTLEGEKERRQREKEKEKEGERERKRAGKGIQRERGRDRKMEIIKDSTKPCTEAIKRRDVL